MSRKRLRSPEVVQYWLMKSEPNKFSIDDLKASGCSPWDGVRNYAARNNMKSMNIGDRVLFYHSNAKPPGVVGLASVTRTAYPDHTALDSSSEYYDAKASEDKNPWEMVDVQFEEKFHSLVSLEQLRGESVLRNMQLFSRSRLSVQPVTRGEYEHIVSIGRKSRVPIY
ncbi:thymocyte nuclear protein 1 [Trypanosoma grayi]|uniref:thymocyte nuclear protein 1 n=1 Tax=Trypanosoma grayi TaxID=71804 RepID=UPI0004F45BCE|nr:thymocyte nuclear protein 1 [Trypanosoma grayi]KEG13163.1 thymocyte nuclear protein 1 [Trypanosoma grayi]